MSAMKKVPLRKCTGCGEMKSKKEMVRIIKDENGDISIDLTGKKNGRGAYICYSFDCLERAEKTKGLERTLKCPVSKEIYEKLKEEFTDR